MKRNMPHQVQRKVERATSWTTSISRIRLYSANGIPAMLGSSSVDYCIIVPPVGNSFGRNALPLSKHTASTTAADSPARPVC